jgi:hypothetical protein
MKGGIKKRKTIKVKKGIRKGNYGSPYVVCM